MGPKRQHTRPAVLRGPRTEDAQLLEPLVLDESRLADGTVFSEDTLQGLLFQNPILIPISEVEPGYGPLIPIARELQTPAGPLDLLFTNPLGYLTIAETKLWKNAEARREVVAQVLDYAKEIARWSYEDLDAAVRKVRPEYRPAAARDGGIREIMVAAGVEFDEPAFIDTVQRNLRNGRFLLLIIGEGIREGVEAMAGYLQGSPAARFSLALVEMALYRAGAAGYPIYVQPRVVARTAEVVRAIVELRGGAETAVAVSVPTEEERAPGERRLKLTEEAFFDRLQESVGEEDAGFVRGLLEALGRRGLEPTWGSSSVSMRLPDPAGQHGEFTVVVFDYHGKFTLGWLDKVAKVGYDGALASGYLRKMCALAGSRPDPKGSGFQPPYPSVGRLRQSRAEFLQEVDWFVDGIRRAASQEGTP